MSARRPKEQAQRDIFSEKFRVLREHLGFAREAYALELDMTVSNMRQIEDGKSTCTAPLLQRMNKHPKTGPYILWLLDDSPKNKQTPKIKQTTEQPIFKDLLTSIIETLEERLINEDKALKPAKKAELIYILYGQAVKSGHTENIDWEAIQQLIEFAIND